MNILNNFYRGYGPTVGGEFFYIERPILDKLRNSFDNCIDDFDCLIVAFIKINKMPRGTIYLEDHFSYEYSLYISSEIVWINLPVFCHSKNKSILPLM